MEKEIYEGTNCLVTGGEGFIGRWIVDDLFKEKANVFVLDKKLERDVVVRDIEKKCKLINGDILDMNVLKSVIKNNKIDYIFHLAANAIISKSIKYPITTFEINTRASYNIFEVARINDVKGIIVASSNTVYGEQKPPYTEDLVLKGNNPYAASKVCMDVIANSYFKTYGLPIVRGRFANNYGEFDQDFTRAVPSIIKAVIENRNPVIESDGTPIRGFIHVNDTARASLLLMKNIKNTAGGAFNVDAETPIQVMELAKKIINISNKKLSLEVNHTRKNVVPTLFMSTDSAAARVGPIP